MRIFIFSDIHGDTRAIERVMTKPADVYIAVGDLSTFGRALERCAEALRPLGHKLWLLPGNHETHEQTRALCDRYGFVDFHRQVRELKGEKGVTWWAGLGYSNPTPFDTPGEYSEEEIAGALEEFEGKKPLYLAVHFPPRGTKLDEVGSGTHAGSATLRAWVERVQPEFLFCGHIHEGAGLSERIGATQCINVGKQGYAIEI
ncbi:MAG TPA: metallophosphoesterase [Candidatus Acidoferrum sp.]|nr:metallophosphoesterase [Candidatus Acidoferrum sp.]